MILALHHVRPPAPRAEQFRPNRHLEVTPDFLDRLIRRLKRARLDFVSLDEMHRRLAAGDRGRRFVCLTFDDGYRDTRRFAYPILKRYQVPFAVYVATSFPDRMGELWWLALEAVIAANSRIGVVMNGRDVWLNCSEAETKQRAFGYLMRHLRRLATQAQVLDFVRDLAIRHGVDTAAFCDELCMTWQEIAELAADPLVTIGAHTVNHVILTKVDERTVRSELAMSRAVIEAALGVQPQHLAYPVGDRRAAGPREFKIAAELGFKTAVTTRPGVLFPRHREHLTALPRLSLNGEFARLRHARVLISGAGTALANGFRRVNAA
jgi:peptidoglycan/xylan/chitin deacetylase (PgdA/CDA1 family)